jgi:phosphate/phosphite/phosphonate ABC transporter binding protein
MKLFVSVLLAAALSFGGAGPAFGGNARKQASSPSTDPPTLVFIIPPVEDVNVMYATFLPLKEYLERAVSRKITLKVAQTYLEAVEHIGKGAAHLAYLDPSAYCEARHRYGVVPLAKTVQAGSSANRSVIVTRADSAIAKIADARGKRLALGSVQSSSSYLIPAVMFKEVGVGLRDFAAVDYLEQEDRIALSVLTRRHELGGLSERVANKYLADGLRVIKTSEAIPQYSICACACLSDGLRSALRDALLAVNKTGEATLAAMKVIDGFAAAEDRDFDVVRVMLKNLSGRNYLEYGGNAVKVAILPLYSAITLFDRFDPLMRHLTRTTGREFKLVIPRDFEDFFETVKRGDVEFSYSNPYIYIQLADAGHLRAFATTVMQASGDIFRGIIITHRSSPIRTIHDLKGKDVMVVSYKSAGGFLAQKLLLAEHGIDVFRDLRLREGKRQEEVILNVYRRTADAGFVRETALDVLREEIDLNRIRVVATTSYIANWPFAVTKNADRALVSLVQKSLLSLKDARVLSAAQITAFRAASDGDFDGLRSRIRQYETR